MRNNQYDSLPIIGIRIMVTGINLKSIYYEFITEDGTISIIEKKIFPTKEELIASL